MAGARWIGSLRAVMGLPALVVAALALGLLPAAASAQPRAMYVTDETDEVLIHMSYDREDGAITQARSVEATVADPHGITMSPDGEHLFATSTGGGSAYLHSFDVGEGGTLTPNDSLSLQTDQPIESIAIAPDGAHLFVGLDLEPDPGCFAPSVQRRCLAPSGGSERDAARRGQPERGNIAVVDVAADGSLALDPGFMVPSIVEPGTLAVSPDGKTLIVAGSFAGAASSYAIGAGGGLTWSGSSVALPGLAPVASQVTPDGEFAYLTGAEGSVTIIKIRAKSGIGLIDSHEPPEEIDVTMPALAMAPDGKGLWAAGGIDTGEGMEESASRGPILEDGTIGTTGLTPGALADAPTGIGAAPGGGYAYVWGGDPAAALSGFLVGSDGIEQVTGSPFAPTVAGGFAGSNDPGQSLAITPNQGPHASFTVSQDLGAKGLSAVSFDASASADPDGQVVKYRWDFGDGHKRTTTDPAIDHTYKHPGSYTAKLRVVDDEGCSKERIFTGQIALCNGSAAAVKGSEVEMGDAKVARPRAKAPSPQRQRGKQVKVKLRAGAAEAVKVAARAKVKIRGVKRAFKTKKASKRAKAGKLAKLTLKVKGKRAARLLKKHRKGAAKVTVKITDRSGNSAMLRRRVKLKR